MQTSRRGLIGVSGAAGLAAAIPGAAQAAPTAPDYETAAWLQAVLERYTAFGVKASGGPGDQACGAWLEGELGRLGYACSHQGFEAPFFDATRADLHCGAATAPVVPQAIVTATGAEGLTAPLRLAEDGVDLAGAIALIVLPFKRWVAVADPQAAEPLAEAFRRGAKACVLVTTGPTREAVALNVTARRPGPGRPVAVLAPAEAAPFLAAAKARKTVTLTIDGHSGRRPAYNLIARLDRGAEKTLILSTPRSGWFGCSAERGSGLAVWLSLAHSLARSKRRLNLELLCTSGHEYQYLGGELYLEAKRPPPPSATKLWVHIGASAAARDWHEIGFPLRPLPSPDSQRVLTATADIVERVRPAFRGISGLEAVYVADRASAGGELVNVLDAGYRSAIGLYGGHRYFHTRGDDLRCVSGEMVEPVLTAFRTAISACLDA